MKLTKLFKENKNITAIFIIIGIIILFIRFSNNEIIRNNHQSESYENSKLKGADSDEDGISDYDEINIYQTDPSKKDSDSDGILDNIEIKNGSSAVNDDSDGDGLLDGKAQYINNKKIAPADPEPLNKNGPNGIWKKQIEIDKNQNIPYYLTTFYEYNTESNLIEKINDIDWKQLIESENLINEIINLPLAKEIASKVLMFRLDNGGKILHSQTNEDIYNYLMSEAKKNLPSTQYTIFEKTIKYLKIEENLETWQKQFGFNILYDEVFRIATNNNMASAQIHFKNNAGNDYVLWMWRGDYLALGSGAEIGLYTKNTSTNSINNLNIEHWDAVDFEVPMTLNLYNYYSEDNIEHIFSWKPTSKQWWITGFNADKQDVDVTKQVVIGTVNFSKHKDMYNSLKEKINLDNKNKDYIIFDDTDSTLWICWYDKNLETK